MSEWKEVSMAEAAHAEAEGMHEYQIMYMGRDGYLTAAPSGKPIYRTRKKRRTITVTIPMPIYVRIFKDDDGKSAVMQLFETHDEATAAQSTIHEAMEQQP